MRITAVPCVDKINAGLLQLGYGGQFFRARELGSSSESSAHCTSDRQQFKVAVAITCPGGHSQSAPCQEFFKQNVDAVIRVVNKGLAASGATENPQFTAEEQRI